MVYPRRLADGLDGTICAIGLSIRTTLAGVAGVGHRSRMDQRIHPKHVRAARRSAAKRLRFNEEMKPTKPALDRSFAAYLQCYADRVVTQVTNHWLS